MRSCNFFFYWGSEKIDIISFPLPWWERVRERGRIREKI